MLALAFKGALGEGDAVPGRPGGLSEDFLKKREEMDARREAMVNLDVCVCACYLVNFMISAVIEMVLASETSTPTNTSV